MRLIHVLDRLAPSGAATQARLLSAAGVAEGDDVTVASLRYPGADAAAFTAAGVRVEWLGARFAIDPFAAIRLRRLVGRLRPDAIQSWDEPSALLCRFARKRGVRWVHVRRSPSDPIPSGPDVMLATDGSMGEPVPNAVDPELTVQLERDAARDQLRSAGVDLANDSPTVAVVARLADVYAIKELVWASDLVRVVRPGLRLLVAGDGPALRAAERFADAATERGTVVWLGDRLDRRIVLAAADVVWCAGDGARSTPILEALAAGRPVVAAAAEGRIEWLASHRPASFGDATITPALGDRAGWARATDRLFADPEAAGRYARDAWRSVAAEHSIAAVSQRRRDALAAV